jgi:hypothetical protein
MQMMIPSLGHVRRELTPAAEAQGQTQSAEARDFLALCAGKGIRQT